MPTVDEILKAEYAMTIEMWKILSKYIKKMPLKDEDYKELADECNKLSESRKGKAQDVLCRWIIAVQDEIEFLDGKIKEAERDKG